MKYTLIDIRNNTLLLNTIKLSSSNIIMYLLPFIVTPILSRLYSTTEFGEWGIFSSFISIVTIAIFLGLENIIIKTAKTEERNCINLCLVVAICTISLIAFVFILGNNENWKFIVNFPSKTLLFIYLIVYSIYTLSYNLANKYEKYSGLAINNIIQGTSQAFFRIIFGIFSITAYNGLILGTTIAQVFSMVALLVIIYTILKKTLKNNSISLNGIKKLFIKHRNFPLYDAPSSLLSFGAFNLPLLILSYYFDKQSIGSYSIILQLLLLPMSFIGSSIGKVYYQQICQAKHKEEISNKTSKVLKLMSIISILPLLLIACGGDKIIVIYLGAQWQNAGDIAICLSLWAFPTVLTQPLLPLYRQKNKQRTLLIFDTFYFIGGISCIWIGCQLTSQLNHILLAYSCVCLFVKLSLFVNILKLGQLKLADFGTIYPLWLLAISILIIRLWL